MNINAIHDANAHRQFLFDAIQNIEKLSVGTRFPCQFCYPISTLLKLTISLSFFLDGDFSWTYRPSEVWEPPGNLIGRTSGAVEMGNKNWKMLIKASSLFILHYSLMFIRSILFPSVFLFIGDPACYQGCSFDCWRACVCQWKQVICCCNFLILIKTR